MRTKNLNEAEYLAMAGRDEDHFFDHKARAVSGRKCQKIAVALANADGGEFVIGIADAKEEASANLRWQGARQEDFNGHIQALSEIKPSLIADYSFLTSTGRSGCVLSVTIEKSSEVHRTAGGEVYQRKGAQSLPLNAQEIQQLAFAKGAASFEDCTVPSVASEDIVDSDELQRFLAAYSPQTAPLDFVVNQNLIDRKTYDPRVAGILLFANNPAALMPRKCSAKIARYTTKEDEPERDHLEGTWELEGPLNLIINRTVKRVTEIMSEINVWTTKGLQKLSYPAEAIWEIIANAFIHRDYSISDDIQVLIYDNRIEVVSPGRLPGYVTPENILESRYSRNSKIVRTLARYPDAPNKDLGEGLNTAFQKMKEWKLRPPVIQEGANYVGVTISHIPLASATEAILEFLETHDEITNRQAREITGIKSENAVKNEFYKLRDAGKLEMVPDKKGSAAAWRIRQPSMQEELPLTES
jgi:ATP-dependent DNA helicase RecG